MDIARRIRVARILGIALCAAGFIAIGLGWNGAAGKACVDCQLPYLISGAAAGIGLLITGGVMLVLAQLYDGNRRIAEAIERGAGGAPLAGAAASPSARANGQVVAGGSTYHLPDCRLVKERTNLPALSVEAARSQGLTPCRVCRPDEKSSAVRAR